MNMHELKQIIYQGEKVDVECKKAETSVPKSAYESYSGFANTKGGYIFLGVREDKTKTKPEERFIIQGIDNPTKQREDFWNTINGDKVNVNILKDEDVEIVEEDGVSVIVINVPRADYKVRPVYVGENPYKGTYKRNNEGDYHMSTFEVDAMIRDRNPDGNDSMILEGFTMEDIDSVTLKHYRQMFQVRNPEHIWNPYDDKAFLESLGGYRKDRRSGAEGLTMAGLMMFGKGLPVRDEFDNIFMDYRDESAKTSEVRWNDRVTYDGTWENNLFNFFTKVTPKLTADLKKPFKLENNQRIDDTSVHKAIREAFVNLIIHSDYLLDAGTLKIIKLADGFEFTNPGILKLPINEIFKGGNSKPRNPRMQTMLRLVGYGDNAGSGFPSILGAWEKEGWQQPELIENTDLNQVTLILKTTSKSKAALEVLAERLSSISNLSEKSVESFAETFKNLESTSQDTEIEIAKKIIDKLPEYSDVSLQGTLKMLKMISENLSSVSGYKSEIIEFAKKIADRLVESAEKSAELAEKSAENLDGLSERHKQILYLMGNGVEYSTDEIAKSIGLKGPRTRQLLNELIEKGKVRATATTKNRRYIKET